MPSMQWGALTGQGLQVADRHGRSGEQKVHVRCFACRQTVVLRYYESTEAVQFNGSCEQSVQVRQE